MSLVTDPVYEVELALNIAEAFSLASEFALAFSIRHLDREGLRIVLNLTCMPSGLLFFTWVKAYVIRVLFLDEHRSLVRVQAQKVISPHHLFRLPFFMAHRIDPEELVRNLQRHFARYEAIQRDSHNDSGSAGVPDRVN